MLRAKGTVACPKHPVAFRYGYETQRCLSIVSNLANRKNKHDIPFHLYNNNFKPQCVRWFCTKSKSKPKKGEQLISADLSCVEFKEDKSTKKADKSPTSKKKQTRWLPDLDVRHHALPLEATTPPKEIHFTECYWNSNSDQVFHFQTTQDE